MRALHSLSRRRKGAKDTKVNADDVESWVCKYAGAREWPCAGSEMFGDRAAPKDHPGF